MDLSELQWLRDARAMLRGAAMEVYPLLDCSCAKTLRGNVILASSCPKCRLNVAIHYADPDTYKTAARLTEALTSARGEAERVK